VIPFGVVSVGSEFYTRRELSDVSFDMGESYSWCAIWRAHFDGTQLIRFVTPCPSPTFGPIPPEVASPTNFTSPTDEAQDEDMTNYLMSWMLEDVENNVEHSDEVERVALSPPVDAWGFNSPLIRIHIYLPGGTNILRRGPTTQYLLFQSFPKSPLQPF